MLKYSKQLSVLFLGLIICSLNYPLEAQIIQTDTSGIIYYKNSDNTTHPLLSHPKDRSGYEKSLRIPITIIEFPFWLMGRGLENSLQYIEHNKIIEKFDYFEEWLDRHHILIEDGSQGIGSGLGPAFGLFKRFGDTKLSISSAATFRGYQGYQVRIKSKELLKNVNLDSRIKYQIRAQDNFFGIGSESKFEDRTQYQQNNLSTRLELTYTTKTVQIAPSISWIKYSKIEHPIWSEQSNTLDKFPGLPGADGSEIFRTGIRINYPALLYEGRPGAESGIDLAIDSYRQLDQHKIGFNRYSLILYQSFPVFWGDRTLAIRGAGSVTNILQDGEIPFYLLNPFGGWDTIRGYEGLRFRSLDYLFFNFEYRYPVWDIGLINGFVIDFVYFYDTGIVSNKVENDLTMKNLLHSIGISIRLRKTLGTILRLSIARSSESTVVGLKLGKDF